MLYEHLLWLMTVCFCALSHIYFSHTSVQTVHQELNSNYFYPQVEYQKTTFHLLLSTGHLNVIIWLLPANYCYLATCSSSCSTHYKLRGAESIFQTFHFFPELSLLDCCILPSDTAVRQCSAACTSLPDCTLITYFFFLYAQICSTPWQIPSRH